MAFKTKADLVVGRIMVELIRLNTWAERNGTAEQKKLANVLMTIFTKSAPTFNAAYTDFEVNKVQTATTSRNIVIDDAKEIIQRAREAYQQGDTSNPYPNDPHRWQVWSNAQDALRKENDNDA
jgi:hypothetical protein